MENEQKIIADKMDYILNQMHSALALLHLIAIPFSANQKAEIKKTIRAKFEEMLEQAIVIK